MIATASPCGQGHGRGAHRNRDCHNHAIGSKAPRSIDSPAFMSVHRRKGSEVQSEKAAKQSSGFGLAPNPTRSFFSVRILPQGKKSPPDRAMKRRDPLLHPRMWSQSWKSGAACPCVGASARAEVDPRLALSHRVLVSKGSPLRHGCLPHLPRSSFDQHHRRHSYRDDGAGVRRA